MKKLSFEDVAVVIPTYNEEKSIENVIDSIDNSFKNIYVIDANSTDRTKDIVSAKKINLIIQKPKGKGKALKQAINEIEKKIIVFIDGDNSHDAKDIPKLIDPIINDNADLVIASRYKGGSDELYGTLNNFLRMVGSSLITLGMNYRWNVRLTDIENGFRAIRRDVALKLKLVANDFTIEQEMVMKAVKRGYKVVEIASHEYERKWGVSKLPTIQGWKFILRFFKDII